MYQTQTLQGVQRPIHDMHTSITQTYEQDANLFLLSHTHFTSNTLTLTLTGCIQCFLMVTPLPSGDWLLSIMVFSFLLLPSTKLFVFIHPQELISCWFVQQIHIRWARSVRVPTPLWRGRQRIRALFSLPKKGARRTEESKKEQRERDWWQWPIGDLVFIYFFSTIILFFLPCSSLFL